MNIGGKDYVFQKSNGDAEWWMYLSKRVNGKGHWNLFDIFFHVHCSLIKMICVYNVDLYIAQN